MFGKEADKAVAVDDERDEGRGEVRVWLSKLTAVRLVGKTLHVTSAAGPGMGVVSEVMPLPAGKHVIELDPDGFSVLMADHRDGRDAVLWWWQYTVRQWQRVCAVKP